LKVAREQGDEKSVVGCFLTKVDTSAVTLELRLRAKDSAQRDKVRSTLLAELARRFAAAHLGGAGSEVATFA
jgi:hypothetical protein